jgi:adenylosuccinate lyase
MEPKNFVGRAPQQTEEFFSEYIDPILEKHSQDLGLHASINV